MQREKPTEMQRTCGCQCSGAHSPSPDPDRLRKLEEGLRRNTTAVSRIISQILEELDEHHKAA